MKNRFFLFLLIGVLVCISCSRKGEDTRYRIVYSYPGGVWYDMAAKAFEQETYVHQEIELKLMPAASRQAQIDDLLALKPGDADLVIVVPLGEDFVPAVERLHDPGVPVILYDHKVNSEKYSAFVTVDSR